MACTQVPERFDMQGTSRSRDVSHLPSPPHLFLEGLREPGETPLVHGRWPYLRLTIVPRAESLQDN